MGISWAVWEASWGRLGSVLEPSWGRLGASWAVLGSITNPKGFNFGMLSWMPFFNWFLVDFASENRSPNLDKPLDSIGKISIFGFQAILT